MSVNLSVTEQIMQVSDSHPNLPLRYLILVASLLVCCVNSGFSQRIFVDQGDPTTLLQLRLGMSQMQVDSAMKGLSWNEKNVACWFYQGEEYCYYYDSLSACYTDSSASSIRLVGQSYRVFEFKDDNKAIRFLQGWLSRVVDGLTKKYSKPVQIINQVKGLDRDSFWSALNEREGEFPLMVWKNKGVVVKLNAGVRSNGKRYVYQDMTDADYGYTDWMYYGVITVERLSTNTKPGKRRG